LVFLRWTRHLASIVTLLAALSGYVAEASQQIQQAAPEQQQDEPRTEATSGANEQNPTLPPKIALDGPIEVINQPSAYEKQRDAEQRAQTDFSDRLQVWTLVFAGIAAAGAVGAWLANRRSATAAEQQIVDARKHADEQRRISLDMLTETKKTADAAKLSAEVADQTMRLTQGAVILQNFVEFKPDEFLPTSRIYWHFKNFGQTSAHDVRIDSAIMTGDATIPIKGSKLESPLTMGRDQTIYVTFGPFQGITPDLWSDIYNGRLKLLIVARVRYADVFGRHQTKGFKGRYRPGSTKFKLTEMDPATIPPGEWDESGNS
jgi:hypothetical protein